MLAEAPRRRADFRAAADVLLVLRDPPALQQAVGQPPRVAGDPAEGREVLLAVWSDGSITALSGHVDLGTGLRTALAQLVAEELDTGMDRVHVQLGDTASVPNQGATIASASIQLHALPLRQAAAQARAWLLARAGGMFDVPAASLRTGDGAIRGAGRSTGYGDLVRGDHLELLLATDTPLKAVADHRVVGRSMPRTDIPAKAFGELTFVHDMRVPGMLHGRVVRPPYAGAAHGDFIGNTLLGVDEASIAHIAGVRAVVVVRDFVGVVAEREDAAEAAAEALAVRWKPWPGLPPLADLPEAIARQPSTKRTLVDEGDVAQALAGAAQRFTRTYVWPYQLHASLGPSCALADWQGDRLTVWAGTQGPHALRDDLARLVGLPATAVDIVRMEAAGCYGRNGADDVAADAALLSKAVWAPVRVQLSREQENAWEPHGAAQLMQVDGALDAAGRFDAYDFETSYPSNGAPTLALLLTRTIEPVATAFEMGDRTARPPYDVPNLRVAVNDMAPILRASWLRGVSALPNTFAHESFVDELATAARVDPVDFRLRHLGDPRAAELVRATAERAGWLPHTLPRQQPAEGDILRGQGVAYARYLHSQWPGFGAAWAAWVADVEVDRRTGEVHVRRVVVGHDAGLMVNPAGVRHQVHGNVLQATSRSLVERVEVDGSAAGGLQSLEWGGYPVLGFRDVPVIEVLMMPRQGEAPLGAGESASVPGTAAIANAIFDATGVRLRQPPFTPDVVRAALNPLSVGGPDAAASPDPAATASPIAPRRWPAGVAWPRRRSWGARVAAVLVGGVGLVAGLAGWRAVVAPIARPDASIYTAATIERGRRMAALGDCAVCHAAPGGAFHTGMPGGATNAGGRAIDTPFGTVHATNLTPDVATGLGAWSYAAFERAMREGVSRDGRHLYPAFPYTAFAKIADDDMIALYAFLMSQPAVHAVTPPADLRFPFGARPLMAGWNALFHDPSPYRPDPARSAEWNRGASLVTGVGHCGACHSGRNALGAEIGGPAFLGGAAVDGWQAPALTAASPTPVAWTRDEFVRYLRTGHTLQHGIAGGPMAAVVRELGIVPDDDIAAMATYLASFSTPDVDPQLRADAVVANARARSSRLAGSAGQRLFEGACSACHHDGDRPRLLGVNRPLALNTNLHAATPDNLLRTVLDGVRETASRDIGFMQGFRGSLNDRQVAEIARFMRGRFAPDRPPWDALEAAVARARARPSPH